jgi:hypothetical protein
MKTKPQPRSTLSFLVESAVYILLIGACVWSLKAEAKTPVVPGGNGAPCFATFDNKYVVNLTNVIWIEQSDRGVEIKFNGYNLYTKTSNPFAEVQRLLLEAEKCKRQ